MRKILRSCAMACLSCCLLASRADAMSHGPIRLDVRQVDGKLAACLPMSDDTGSEPIRISWIGVTRGTGPVSPVVTYWALEIPERAPPVYLKRGECLVYGQAVAGAIVRTPPRTLDIDKFYSISIVPAGNDGPVYGSAFCVIGQAGGGIRIARPGQQGNPCAAAGH
ncbi:MULTISPECIES: hypothetical protein [Burkholderia]|uniref:Lipoprotein n=1 Tax=Burkholderia aenigmatica TaxID=2015348 RepID=A0A6J5JSF1_9BURK|nr:MULTISPECIES: hypothetical protein [Burkholderia]CAB3974025.1 lipoprotein [Burkholderia aenigmatica]